MRAARCAFALTLILAASPALGQTGNVQTSFATQLFEPAIGTGMDTFFSVEGPGVADHLSFGIGLLFNYQHRPLVLYTQEKVGTVSGGFDITKATELDVVKSQLSADLAGALGLHYKWLHAQVGLDLPVNLYISGNNINETGEKTGTFSSGGLGDLQLQLKVMLFRNLAGFSLAFSPILTFPTGRPGSSSGGAYAGDPNVSFRPRLVAGWSWRDLFVAADLGYLVRQSSALFSSEVGSQLLFGAAVGYRVHPRVVAMAELFGRSGFATKSNCTDAVDPQTGQRVSKCPGSSNTDLDAHPLEAVVGARVTVAHGIDLTAGVGFGIIRALGSPVVRALLGARWAPDFKDTDGDGIPDYKDQCPTQPEDKDGFQDTDGCPDPDNDTDLIPDSVDKCPNEPEDKDGFQDEDGCPDPDNDGDKIPDLKDGCPFQPETYNGFKDDDGCPDEPDKDGDGIPDAKDKCPNDPEDKDGFEDLDGCPDPDNDGDGVPDKFDDCPNDAEDMDGFKDDDGCPDPDNDGDGLCDPWVEKQGLQKKYAHICTGSDKCPNEPETINGFKDDDGCPDKGESHVSIKEGKLVITKKIFFDTSKATIKKISNSILGEVSLVLQAHQEIKGVRIEGHTDSQGDAKKNKALSQSRAEAVRTWLVNKGIAAGRLFAVGFGAEKPIADNRTNKGREQNRRVEFIILEQGDGGGDAKGKGGKGGEKGDKGDKGGEKKEAPADTESP